MHNHRILILNCTQKSDPDEGAFLAELMESIELRYPKRVRHQVEKVSNSQELRENLVSDWPTIIHIASHGKRLWRPKTGRTETCIVVGGWPLYASDVSKMNGKITAELVFANACSNSYLDMAKAMIGKGARFFCAPKIDVYWADAVVYTAVFYHRLIWKDTSVERAGRFAKTHTRLGYAYPDWWSMR